MKEEEERRRVQEEEEREIKHLEKQLHMNKRKTKSLPKAFIGEGLDYILDCIDPDKAETVREQEKNDVWTSELDDPEAEETVTLGGAYTRDDNESDTDDEEEDDEELSDDEEVSEGDIEDESQVKSGGNDHQPQLKTQIFCNV